MLLITVQLPPGATIESAMRRLELSREEVDAEYGLVPIDPDAGLYVLRVTQEAGHRIGMTPEPDKDIDPEDYRGPWSDPRIEPFGPPQ